MPLVRVTPENAVGTVHEQVEDFRQAIAAAGRAPAFRKLAERADELAALISTGTLEAEMLAIGDLHPQWTGSLAHWLGVDGEILARTLGEAAEPWPADAGGGTSTGGVSLVRVRRDLAPAGRRAGVRVPPILVVASGSAEPLDETVLEEVVGEMRRRPLTLLVGPEGADWGRALAGLGSREDWEAKFMPLETLTQRSLQESFGKPPWAQAGKMACAWSVTRALASLETAFSVLLEKEGRALAAKKAALEKRGGRAGGISNPNEVIGEVRGYLQKRFDGFQKEASAELADLVAPYDGTLTREVEARIDAFSGFEYEKKPKVDVITVPDAVEGALLERTREALTALLRGQWTRMRELLRSAEGRVETILEDRAAPPVAVHFHHLPEKRLETIIERGVQLNRPYRGELSRRGPMDYFMAARRYQMMFFMVFSAFSLSFIRQLTYFTVPAGVVLLAFGMLNVVNAAKKQRAEAEAKELGKARDALRTDLARSMGDVQKAWDQAVSNHLAAQQSQALESVESTVKSVAAQASREAAQEKELAQQQMKGLDAAQRKITDGVRTAEAAATDMENLSGQLIEFYGKIVGPADGGEGPAGGKPGVPGPGAMPGAAAGASGAGAGAAGAAAKLKAQAEQKLKALQGGAGGAAGKARPGRSGGAGGSDKKAGRRKAGKLNLRQKAKEAAQSGGSSAGPAGGGRPKPPARRAGSTGGNAGKARAGRASAAKAGDDGNGANGANGAKDMAAKIAKIKADAEKRLKDAQAGKGNAAGGKKGAGTPGRKKP